MRCEVLPRKEKCAPRTLPSGSVGGICSAGGPHIHLDPPPRLIPCQHRTLLPVRHFHCHHRTEPGQKTGSFTRCRGGNREVQKGNATFGLPRGHTQMGTLVLAPWPSSPMVPTVGMTSPGSNPDHGTARCSSDPTTNSEAGPVLVPDCHLKFPPPGAPRACSTCLCHTSPARAGTRMM